MTFRRGEVRFLLWLAAGLYGLGLLILLSPVRSDVPYDGQVSSDGDFTSVCGLALPSALVRATEEDSRRDRKRDCAANASGRVGYGFLFLVAAAPVTVAALAARERRD